MFAGDVTGQFLANSSDLTNAGWTSSSSTQQVIEHFPEVSEHHTFDGFTPYGQARIYNFGEANVIESETDSIVETQARVYVCPNFGELTDRESALNSSMRTNQTLRTRASSAGKNHTDLAITQDLAVYSFEGRGVDLTNILDFNGTESYGFTLPGETLRTNSGLTGSGHTLSNTVSKTLESHSDTAVCVPDVEAYIYSKPPEGTSYGLVTNDPARGHTNNVGIEKKIDTVTTPEVRYLTTKLDPNFSGGTNGASAISTNSKAPLQSSLTVIPESVSVTERFVTYPTLEFVTNRGRNIIREYVDILELLDYQFYPGATEEVVEPEESSFDIETIFEGTEVEDLSGVIEESSDVITGIEVYTESALVVGLEIQLSPGQKTGSLETNSEDRIFGVYVRTGDVSVRDEAQPDAVSEQLESVYKSALPAVAVACTNGATFTNNKKAGTETYSKVDAPGYILTTYRMDPSFKFGTNGVSGVRTNAQVSLVRQDVEIPPTISEHTAQTFSTVSAKLLFDPDKQIGERWEDRIIYVLDGPDSDDLLQPSREDSATSSTSSIESVMVSGVEFETSLGMFTGDLVTNSSDFIAGARIKLGEASVKDTDGFTDAGQLNSSVYKSALPALFTAYTNNETYTNNRKSSWASYSKVDVAGYTISSYSIDPGFSGGTNGTERVSTNATATLVRNDVVVPPVVSNYTAEVFTDAPGKILFDQSNRIGETWEDQVLYGLGSTDGGFFESVSSGIIDGGSFSSAPTITLDGGSF